MTTCALVVGAKDGPSLGEGTGAEVTGAGVTAPTGGNDGSPLGSSVTGAGVTGAGVTGAGVTGAGVGLTGAGVPAMASTCSLIQEYFALILESITGWSVHAPSLEKEMIPTCTLVSFIMAGPPMSLLSVHTPLPPFLAQKLLLVTWLFP